VIGNVVPIVEHTKNTMKNINGLSIFSAVYFVVYKHFVRIKKGKR